MAGKGPHMMPVNDLSEIPRFKTEAEEHTFWATHYVSRKLLALAKPPPARVQELRKRMREDTEQTGMQKGR